LSIQSTATTTKKKKEAEGAWRSKASRDGGGERGTSFELQTQCFISPPLPRGFVFCTHISSHLPTCTCTSAKSKGTNFLYTSAIAKAAPLVIYLCNNNNLAATLLLQQYLCNSKAATLLYICSSSSTAAAKLPTFLYLCNSSTAPTSLQNQQKNCSQIRRLCSKSELKSTNFGAEFMVKSANLCTKFAKVRDWVLT
jgi:hypothetical protein